MWSMNLTYLILMIMKMDWVRIKFSFLCKKQRIACGKKTVSSYKKRLFLVINKDCFY